STPVPRGAEPETGMFGPDCQTSSAASTGLAMVTWAGGASPTWNTCAVGGETAKPSVWVTVAVASLSGGSSASNGMSHAHVPSGATTSSQVRPGSFGVVMTAVTVANG